MKKRTVWSVVLMVLCALSLMVASNPTAVTVFRTGDSVARRYSFFQPIAEAPIAICLLYAAISNGVALMISVVFLIRKKNRWLKWILGLSFASMTLAVMPLIIRSEPVVLPNMVHPLAMCATSVMAYVLLRTTKEAADETPKGERLPVH